MNEQKRWFRFDVIDESKEATINIFSEIGDWGLTLQEFNEMFQEVKNYKNIKVLLNSPGGSVDAGISIYNLLSQVKDKVTVEVIGMAASVASVIALAGSKVIMDSGSMMMIHDPSMGLWGNAEELRKNADILDKYKARIIEIYKDKTNKDENELAKMMKDETWMLAEEAIEHGFADEVNEAAVVENSAISNFDLAQFKKAPRQIKQKNISTVRDLEKALRDVGLSNSEAKKVASLHFADSPRDEAEKAEEVLNLEELLKVL